MLSPNNTRVCPPLGWSVTIENAGPEIRDNNFEAWIHAVGNRLRANNMDEHNWRAKAIDLMCRQRPDIACEDDELPRREVTGDDIRRYVKVIWETWKSGAQAVDVAEQDRRAEICLKCPKRGYVSCLGGCGALAQALAEVTVGSKSRYIPDLHKSSCMACSCELSTLIMFPLNVLQAVDEKTKFPASAYDVNCWKVQPNIPNLSDPSSAQPPPG